MIQHEWETRVQPILDNVYLCITHIMEGRDDGEADLFRKCGPVGLYTTIYQITTSYSFDFFQLDFLYQQEVQSVQDFCRRFPVHDLEGVVRHIQGFQLLVRWFYCFFHHLNRTRRKIYPGVGGVEEDMDRAIRDHYFRPQKETLSRLVRDHWHRARTQGGPTDHTLLETLTHIAAFDPPFYQELVGCYDEDLRAHARQKAGEWSSQGTPLSYMEKVARVFHREGVLFLFYFPPHKHRLPLVYALLRDILVHPYQDHFLHDRQHGWKALLRAHDLPALQTSCRFYSWVEDPSSWWGCHRDFLEETVQSFPADNRVAPLERLCKEQNQLWGEVLVQETVRSRFQEIFEKTLQKTLSHDTQMVYQLVRSLHQHLVKRKVSTDLCGLIQYCGQKDLFYECYHRHLKARLLSGRACPTQEERVLGFLQEAFGVSFVLNLRLMVGEAQDCLSQAPYHLFRVSGVVWGVEKPYQFRLPPCVEAAMRGLQEGWRGRTDPSLRLDMQWHQGHVVLSRGSNEFSMSPIQAIVLLALETPTTRKGLPGVLGVPDDDHHNLDGVLESLARPGWVAQRGEEWHWTTRPGRPAAPPVRTPSSREHGPTGLPTAVAEAFLVRTMKREKTLALPHLMALLLREYPTTQATHARKWVDSLVEREYLLRGENNTLCYVP
jgi:hypothetical protein